MYPPTATQLLEELQAEKTGFRNSIVRILEKLVQGGAKGVTNFELTNISLRFGARICELRRIGFEISSKEENGITGRWRYVLKGVNLDSALSNQLSDQTGKRPGLS